MSRSTIVAALLATLAVPNLSTAGEDAETAFNNHCRNCHSAKRGDNRLGPSLHNIVGAEAGRVAGFRGYSGGLAGFTWDEAVLDRFMADPVSVSAGTNMIFPPVADPADRKKIIEFLKSKSAP